MASGMGKGPLSGYRVLELGSIVAGPFCGRLFADFGADVIKIEPAEGDGIRSTGKRYNGKSLYAASILRNKKLVSIDLRTKRGQELTKQLALKSDVVIENFRPGQLEKWGLGYDELSKEKPGLVMVRISGFGQTGPYSAQPGYGVISEAMSGLRHITGDPDRPPARVGVALTDYVTGLYAAFGAMVALDHRNRTGQGQVVDAALYESAFSFMERFVPVYEKLGIDANRTGSRLVDTAPNNLYLTKDGRYVHITGTFDGVFKRLVEVMERPDLLDDPRFANAISRGENYEAIDAIVGEWVATYSVDDVEQKLSAAGVPASRIFSVADVFRDPHYKARGMLVDAPDDDLGTVKLAGPVPKLSATPATVEKSGGRIGQDTRTVLSEVAGLTEAEIDELVAAKVVAVDRKQ